MTFWQYWLDFSPGCYTIVYEKHFCMRKSIENLTDLYYKCLIIVPKIGYYSLFLYFNIFQVFFYFEFEISVSDNINNFTVDVRVLSEIIFSYSVVGYQRKRCVETRRRSHRTRFLVFTITKWAFLGDFSTITKLRMHRGLCCEMAL